MFLPAHSPFNKQFCSKMLMTSKHLLKSTPLTAPLTPHSRTHLFSAFPSKPISNFHPFSLNNSGFPSISHANVPSPVSEVYMETPEVKGKDFARFEVLKHKMEEFGIDITSCTPGQYNYMLCPMIGVERQRDILGVGEMADLFHKQAKQYSETRPSYPPELFQFISSKTPIHDLVWDVGTGSGQAAVSLAEIYKNVIATDTSQKQLDFAPKISNIRYQQTPSIMSISELEQNVASQSTVDLVTIAQALHWFDFPTFYQQVKLVLKKPNGIIAAWCYTMPEINDSVDLVFLRFYFINSKPFWNPARKLVDDKYSTIEFPFEPIDGEDHIRPFVFKTERLMNLEDYFTYIRSYSAYQTAKEKGVELLSDEVIRKFELSWNEDGNGEKIVTFPIYLKMGRVGDVN